MGKTKNHRHASLSLLLAHNTFFIIAHNIITLILLVGEKREVHEPQLGADVASDRVPQMPEEDACAAARTFA